MTVAEMVQRAGFEVKTAADRLDAEITGGYAGDLLSAVMAGAKEGNVWVTWHAHPNIVAVALVTRLSAIVLVSGRQPEEETIRKAEEEGLPILVGGAPAFQIVAARHDMGISGTR